MKNKGLIRHLLFAGWITAYQDLTRMMEWLRDVSGKSAKSLVIVFLSIIMSWFMYVPIHELLHVAGCELSGGVVTELQMGREYGADFFHAIFPFITPQTTKYAGRLTGFVPGGKRIDVTRIMDGYIWIDRLAAGNDGRPYSLHYDLSYLVTDIMPFMITIFPGVFILKIAIRRRNITLLGPGIVVGLAPFMNLTGDYFEMSGIVITRFTYWLFEGLAGGVSRFWQIRSDDIFRLIGDITAEPSGFGLEQTGSSVMTIGVILISLFGAVVMCGWTYQFGSILSDRILRRRNST